MTGHRFREGSMAEYILAICAAVLAVIYLAIGAQLPPVVIGDPLGPKVFPAIIGCGMLLSAIVIMLEARAKTRTSLETAIKATHDSHGESKARMILCGMAVWTLAYYMIFEGAGYVLSTVIYVMGMLIYFHPRRWMANVLIAIGFTGVAYGVFAHLLGVALPRGILGI